MRDYHRLTLILLLGLGLVRLIGMYFSPQNLHGDEAQYWAWSRAFDWGYFSKPPMIAWLIGLTTSIFGNSEWAVRISSPLLHPLIAYVLFRTACFVYDARTGFWSVCVYFLMPAVWLSSGIVSTDVSLLLFWVLGLNAVLHMRETPNVKWALLLGLAMGFGMLSKYAMLFFLPALALCIIVDTKSRKAFVSLYGFVVAGVASIIIAPNVWWNTQHDFATISHTAANANLKGIPFHPVELFEFWLSQFGVFGPITMGILILALFVAVRGRLERRTLLLALFVLSPLLVISLEALLSRANANWAVTAYAAGSILVARYGVLYLPGWLKSGVVLNTIVSSVFAVIALSPALTNALGLANSVKRVRGWPQTESMIVEAVKAGHDGRAFSAIATDNRLVFFDLLYYGIETDTGLPLRMWRETSHINHHAEAIASLEASKLEDGPVLIVNYYRDCEDEPETGFAACIDRVHARGKLTFAEKLREDFDRLEKLPPLTLDLGGGKTRKLNLWAGYGYTLTDKAKR